MFGHVESWVDPDQQQNQEEVLQLKLVCKQFRDIYASYSELVRRVYLDNDFSVRILPSLLAWLQRSNSVVQVFQSDCNSPLADVAMAMLASLQQSVNMVNVCGVSECSTSIVALVRNLERCDLFDGNTQELDLAPLGVLPSLSHLILEGSYKQLHNLVGLTELECSSAKISDVQDAGSALYM